MSHADDFQENAIEAFQIIRARLRLSQQALDRMNGFKKDNMQKIALRAKPLTKKHLIGYSDLLGIGLDSLIEFIDSIPDPDLLIPPLVAETKKISLANDDFQERVREVLIFLRHRFALTQEVLGQELGKSQGDLNYLESGQMPVGLYHRILARYCDHSRQAWSYGG